MSFYKFQTLVFHCKGSAVRTTSTHLYMPPELIRSAEHFDGCPLVSCDGSTHCSDSVEGLLLSDGKLKKLGIQLLCDITTTIDF